jgi:EpsI family protein
MNIKSRSMLRFLVVWAVLAATALLLNARSSFESIPNRQTLSTFPLALGEWSGKDQSLPPDVLEILGPGDFLSRIYRDSSGRQNIDLFIAYYPSQRTGDTIHSPQNCLPGAGWTPLATDHIQIPDVHSLRVGSSVTANRYILAKGMDRMLVLYWYQAHGRTTPSEYWAKFYLVRDSIAMNRSDGAMVRVAMRIPDASIETQVQATAVEFSQLVLSKLENYIPQ